MLNQKQLRILPGFNLTMGVTLLYLGLIVLIPLTALIFKTFSFTFEQFISSISSARAVASYKLTIGASLLATGINVIFGLLIAWILVRYDFFGKKLIDALVDLPFALPTAIAGIAITSLLTSNGILGKFFKLFGIELAFNPKGVVIALVFISLPFIVRTVQPVLQDLDKEIEESALCLGANRLQIFFKIILPSIFPALLTGFAMALARCVGEYGSVIFIAGNIPLVSEITSLIIISKLDQYDYVGATSIGTVMLIFSFGILLTINFLQRYQDKRMVQ